MKARIGEVTVTHDANGVARYSVEVWHDGFTNGHNTFSGAFQYVVLDNAQRQAKDWDKQWAERSRKKAVEDTAAAQNLLDYYTSQILKHTLVGNVTWVPKESEEPFVESKPVLASMPTEPKLPQLPPEPQPSDFATPALGLLDRLISSRRERLLAEHRGRIDFFRQAWKQEVAQITRAHTASLRAHEQEVHRLRQKHEDDVAAWQKRQAEHAAKQAARRAEVEKERAEYEALVPARVVHYFDQLLELSPYLNFPKKRDMEYDAPSATLVVDYALPAPDDLSNVKALKYVPSTGETVKQHVTESQAAKIYDGVLYQVVLRTVYELFRNDTAHALSVVVLNGIVTSIDRRTGKPVTACVLSLRANRDEMLDIDLAHVDPKACFKMLKGVGSSNLHGLSPVAPIMPLNRNDSRFVPAYEVANTLDDSVNLAAMDWQDFEHLIRELFEQEFARTGGEVKVTQASRDGGVDAVAFDPDPIRGGKIIIQAKRYTNTVGVSAVRDLYGTVVNEGATKGVLVTTSDYGSDSYDFANGKPLVLLSGANLLHMLQKHGHKAHIDLIAAKKLALGT